MKFWCRHHYHNLGPVVFARCGGVILYEWECCNCAKRGRTPYTHAGPGLSSMSATPDWDEVQRWKALGAR
jgi:hypothetical protein